MYLSLIILNAIVNGHPSHTQEIYFLFALLFSDMVITYSCSIFWIRIFRWDTQHPWLDCRNMQQLEPGHKQAYPMSPRKFSSSSSGFIWIFVWLRSLGLGAIQQVLHWQWYYTTSLTCCNRTRQDFRTLPVDLYILGLVLMEYVLGLNHVGNSCFFLLFHGTIRPGNWKYISYYLLIMYFVMSHQVRSLHMSGNYQWLTCSLKGDLAYFWRLCHPLLLLK